MNSSRIALIAVWTAMATLIGAGFGRAGGAVAFGVYVTAITLALAVLLRVAVLGQARALSPVRLKRQQFSLPTWRLGRMRLRDQG